MGSFISLGRIISTPQLLCDTSLLSNVVATRPLANVNWDNELLESGTQLNGDLEFNFSIQAENGNTPQMIGLDSDDSSTSYNTIDYAIYLYKNGTTTLTRVYENGAYRGDFTPWSVGDTFKIIRTGTVIEYQMNGVTFYTSTTPSSIDLQVGSSFYSQNTGTWSTGSIELSNITFCQI